MGPSDGDLNILRWAYKHAREIARRMPVYRGEYAPEHPAFPEGSEAAAGPADGPVPIDAPKLRYTEADDRAIDEYSKRFGKVLSPSKCSLMTNYPQKRSWNNMAFCKYSEFLIASRLNQPPSQCGTCAMKPREKGGVVDERLNVYGVENLKVAGKY